LPVAADRERHPAPPPPGRAPRHAPEPALAFLAAAGDAAGLVVLHAPWRAALDPRLPGRAVRAAAALPRDGIVLVVAPPPMRALVLRRLAGTLSVRDALLRLTGPGGRLELVPLDPRAGGGAVVAAALGAGTPRRRIAARACRSAAARRLLGRGGPGVAVALRRPGAPPPFAWLGAPGAAVHLRASGRRAIATAYVRGAPDVVAKLAAGADDRLERERAAITRFGPAAARAGARVPEVLALRRLAAGTALLERPLPGEPADALLPRAPDALWPLLTALAGWLGRWHALEARPAPATAARLAAWLLDPAAELGRELPGGDGYRSRLQQLAAGLAGTTVPVVPAHHDLTMANVLWRGDEVPAIVDWEHAAADGLPLMDLAYATTDAIHRATGRSRAAAFRACFAPGGADAERTRALLALLPDRVRPRGAVRELALHAALLRHARNERRAGTAGERPFLAMLAAAAATPPSDEPAP
jgi:hypothetical protein